MGSVREFSPLSPSFTEVRGEERTETTWQSFQGGVAVSARTCECPVPSVQPKDTIASHILSSKGSLFLGMLSLP